MMGTSCPITIPPSFFHLRFLSGCSRVHLPISPECFLVLKAPTLQAQPSVGAEPLCKTKKMNLYKSESKQLRLSAPREHDRGQVNDDVA